MRAHLISAMVNLFNSCRTLLVCSGLLFSAVGSSHAVPLNTLNEGFENFSLLPSAGWSVVNNSSPLGSETWAQGNAYVGGAPFSAQAGGSNSFAKATYNSATLGGAVSNWLITPELNIANGATLSFWTRENNLNFENSMEVRLSTSGSSTNVGSTSSSVGDFSSIVFQINPTLAANGYPSTWTQYNFTVTGLSSPITGRFGFRYRLPNTNTQGTVVGVDTVVYTVPEPSTTGLLSLALLLLISKRRRWMKSLRRMAVV